MVRKKVGKSERHYQRCAEVLHEIDELVAEFQKHYDAIEEGELVGKQIALVVGAMDLGTEDGVGMVARVGLRTVTYGLVKSIEESAGKGLAGLLGGA